MLKFVWQNKELTKPVCLKKKLNFSEIGSLVFEFLLHTDTYQSWVVFEISTIHLFLKLYALIEAACIKLLPKFIKIISTN